MREKLSKSERVKYVSACGERMGETSQERENVSDSAREKEELKKERKEC